MDGYSHGLDPGTNARLGIIRWTAVTGPSPASGCFLMAGGFASG